MLAHLSGDVGKHLVLTLSNSTLNIAFGKVSITFAITSIASSFAISYRTGVLCVVTNCE